MINRKEMKKKRMSLDEHTFLLLSQAIHRSLEALPQFQAAKTVGLYVSYRHEVDTRMLIERYLHEKRLCVPRVEGDQLQFYALESLEQLHVGTYGVLEPEAGVIVPPEQIDVMIIPMLYFDRCGNRIGYGGGFYDRYLVSYPHLKVGIAFSFQEVGSTHSQPHDIPLDFIITEREIIKKSSEK